MRPNHKPAALDPGVIDQVLEGMPASSSDEAVRRVEETVAFLRTAPAPVARPESTGNIIARIAREERAPQTLVGASRGWAGALAASLLVGLFVTYWSSAPVSHEQALTINSHEQAQAWLVEAQERDGHWDAGRWGGHPSHEVALTALSLLALLDGADMSPARRDAVYRAGHYLISQLQTQDSRQAERGAGARNLRMAALALVAAYHHFPEPDWREPARIATQTLAAGQTAAGGWGYVSPEDTDIQMTALDKDQIRMQAAQWLTAAQAENWERLGGTVYVMARTSLLL